MTTEAVVERVHGDVLITDAPASPSLCQTDFAPHERFCYKQTTQSALIYFAFLGISGSLVIAQPTGLLMLPLLVVAIVSAFFLWRDICRERRANGGRGRDGALRTRLATREPYARYIVSVEQRGPSVCVGLVTRRPREITYGHGRRLCWDMGDVVTVREREFGPDDDELTSFVAEQRLESERLTAEARDAYSAHYGDRDEYAEEDAKLAARALGGRGPDRGVLPHVEAPHVDSGGSAAILSAGMGGF